MAAVGGGTHRLLGTSSVLGSDRAVAYVLEVDTFPIVNRDSVADYTTAQRITWNIRHTVTLDRHPELLVSVKQWQRVSTALSTCSTMPRRSLLPWSRTAILDVTRPLLFA